MAYEKKERGDGSRRNYRKDGENKGFSADKKPFGKRSFGKRGGHDRRRSKGDHDRKGHRKDDRRDHGRENRLDRSYNTESEHKNEARKLNLPQDASRLLCRGIDCQVNGNNNLAMIMFLHGSVMMSEGCQNNAVRILKESGKDRFVSIRTDIMPNCSTEAMIEFDYLCIGLDKNYDRTFFDRMFIEGNIQAIYRTISLEEIDGADPIVDSFASMYPDDPDKVVKGLEIMKRKKDSPSAEAHLLRIQEAIELKRSINVMFTRAMNGDSRAVSELKKQSKNVPEAAFFSEFLAAKNEGNQVEWLRSKYPQYHDLIISKQGEFKIQDTPFGMYLKAKNLESKKEEFMSVMMNAARAGSPEAMEELSRKMFRNDVRKTLASIYLKDNDLPKLLEVYEAGLDDQYYLDQYCAGDEGRIIMVGKELGKASIGKEIDWLKDHYDKGMGFCKDEIISRSKDERYHSKKMIYALHDVGADMEAAELYFAMGDNPELPSVKWLKKVCGDDEVKEYVRNHFESLGDISTFDSIFEDDGYERRPQRGRGPQKKKFGKPRR